MPAHSDDSDDSGRGDLADLAVHAAKRDTFWRDVTREPVQFAGWKQFTKVKNDRPPTPRGDILRLRPAAFYIQIQ